MFKKLLASVLICASLLLTITPGAEAASVSQVESYASKYMGTPYKWGGTTPSGFDCSGYVQYVFKEMGISIPRDTSSQWKTGTAVSKANLKVGDLVFFNTYRTASHNGFYIGNNKFIHSSTSQGVMISSINDPYYWGSRYVGARRVVNETAAAPAPVKKQEPKVEVKSASIDFTVYANRAVVAEQLAKRLNLKAKSTKPIFSDVPATHPQFNAIQAVAEAGIFDGDNGKFKPSNAITRAHVAKVLVNGFDLKDNGQAGINFKDVPSSNHYYNYVKVLSQHGLTIGDFGNYHLNNHVSHKHIKLFIDRSAEL